MPVLVLNETDGYSIPGAKKLEGNSKMIPVFCGKRSLKNGCCQCLRPQGSSSCLSRGFPRSAGDLAPLNYCFCFGSQIIEDFAGCNLSEKSFYFPQLFGSPENKPNWPSKPNVPSMCTPLPGAKSPGWWTQCWVLYSLFLGKNSSAVVIVPQFVGHPPWQYGFWLHGINTLLPVSLWFSL